MELSQLIRDDVALMLPCPLEASGDFPSTGSPQLWEGWLLEISFFLIRKLCGSDAGLTP